MPNLKTKKQPALAKLIPIPIFRDAVAAGFPSPAQEIIEAGLDLNDLLIAHRAATYFVKVTGESMIDAGIYDGDILIVDRSLEPSNGQIVIAAVDGDLTVKKIYKHGKELSLIPANINYKPIKIEAGTGLEIWGVVTCVIHRFK